MTASANNNCDGRRCSLRTDHHASMNLCLSQPVWTTTTKRREWNRIELYYSSNSEAEVTNNRRLRSTYCTIEAKAYYSTTDRHEAFRGISAPAELLAMHRVTTHKWSTGNWHEKINSGVRRSKVEITQGRRQIYRPGGGIYLII